MLGLPLLAFRQHMKSVAPTPLWDAPVDSISPLAVVDSVTPSAKVWMVVGAKDPIAPVVYSATYATALRSRRMQTRTDILPGLGHEILLEPQVMDDLRSLITSL